MWVITQGTTADCTQAHLLIANLPAVCLLADRGYDSDSIIKQAHKQGIKPVIPPRKHRKIQRDYDKSTYKMRRIIENTFLRMKRWRGIATRYAKKASSFLAAV
ncbi:MAG: transposase, partial [Amoebophilaceae bacterium]|nr:transposase [Amoebophilaceae bacterium]